MADVGEMTESRKRILQKKCEVEMARFDIKMTELEIRKLETEEELRIIDKKIAEVRDLRRKKRQELGGIDG